MRKILLSFAVFTTFFCLKSCVNVTAQNEIDDIENVEIIAPICAEIDSIAILKDKLIENNNAINNAQEIIEKETTTCKKRVAVIKEKTVTCCFKDR